MRIPEKKTLTLTSLLIALLVIPFSTRAQKTQKSASSVWFDEMLNANSTAGNNWNNIKSSTWESLRKKHTAHEALLEMSWEERDSIWHAEVSENIYNTLAGRYRKAYLISCNERGIKPEKFDTIVNNLAGLKQLRNSYLESRKAEYVILTPKAGKEVRLNGADVLGAKPGNELIYRLAVTGAQPITLKVEGLPATLKFNSKTGVINGSLPKKGNFKVRLLAQNKYGKAEKQLTIKVGDTISLTPPMGWNSWNSFACDVTAADIRNSADQLISTGLANYGWSYVNIDDCWMKKPDFNSFSKEEKTIREDYYNRKTATRIKNKKLRFNEPEMVGQTRSEDGTILSNKDFPDMRKLTDYIHQKGLKAGIYTSPGPLTCQSYEGSYQHELADAQQFARWGFDYLKYDWCGYFGISDGKDLEEAKVPYRLMGNALKQIPRDIVYSICQYGWNKVWEWGANMGGNAWRTTGDIRDTWASLSRIGFRQAGLEKFAGPGHWNDPDMLVVGYVGWSKNLRPTYLSPNEQYTHISLWSLLAAPMLIGCDLTRMDDFTFGLLSNPEVIAVNQDILGKQASRILNKKNIQVWAKPLADGSTAIGIFNTGELPVDFKLNIADLKLSGNESVRDLWTQKEIGNLKDISFKINRHGTKLIKISKI